MELTPRLQAVACGVPKGARFADVGTDHGLLPVWLLKQGVLNYAIVSDLREGPLDAARRTAARYGVQAQISFRLCDGLARICPEEVDTVAIAGMGGDTIAAILTAAPWTAQEGRRLLLQPMTAQPELRQWLYEHGYAIISEKISREGERLYSIWTVQGGTMPALSPGELWAGRQSGSPLRGAYLDYMAGKVRRALDGNLAAARPDPETVAHLQETLNDLLRMKEELCSAPAGGQEKECGCHGSNSEGCI